MKRIDWFSVVAWALMLAGCVGALYGLLRLADWLAREGV